MSAAAYGHRASESMSRGFDRALSVLQARGHLIDLPEPQRSVAPCATPKSPSSNIRSAPDHCGKVCGPVLRLGLCPTVLCTQPDSWLEIGAQHGQSRRSRLALTDHSADSSQATKPDLASRMSEIWVIFARPPLNSFALRLGHHAGSRAFHPQWLQLASCKIAPFEFKQDRVALPWC